jgi:hypothetical protein
MAKSVTYYSNKHGARQLRLELTQTPDIATNSSRIDWKFISAGSSSDATLFQVYETWIKINGTQVWHNDLIPWYGNGSSSNPKAVFPACEGSTSGSVTVYHNADGTLTIPIYFKTAVYASAHHKDYGGNWTLDSIPRPGALTAAPNFNDEENPTITYTNPPGNTTEELVAGIYNDGGSVAYAGYRNITKTGTSYTFSLTDAERKALRDATPNSNTMTVRFYMRTKLGGTHYYSSIAKTLTIKNPNPTLNPTVVDSNNTTKALTGDANKLVKYFSNAYYTINAGAVKGASLSSQKVTHAGSSKTTATGTYNAVENGSFAFEAKDSRGNTSTKTVTKTMINYVKLTCNQDIHISTSGVATIKATGNYFNASFGAVANTLSLQYRWKTQGGSWSSWTNITNSKSGNTYSGTATITGLNYKTNYVFQCRAVDKLMDVSTAEKTTKALPVFDWGKDGFQFNVPVSFAAGYQAAAINEAMVIDEDEELINGDYVIEQGIAMVDGFVWQYRKWNGGSYECWGISNISTAINTQWGALYVSGYLAATDKKFPITFASTPNVNASLSGSGAGGFLIASGSGAPSTTSTGVYEIARGTALANPGTFHINYQVKGRWR